MIGCACLLVERIDIMCWFVCPPGADRAQTPAVGAVQGLA